MEIISYQKNKGQWKPVFHEEDWFWCQTKQLFCVWHAMSNWGYHQLETFYEEQQVSANPCMLGSSHIDNGADNYLTAFGIILHIISAKMWDQIIVSSLLKNHYDTIMGSWLHECVPLGFLRFYYWPNFAAEVINYCFQILGFSNGPHKMNSGISLAQFWQYR